MAPAVEWDAEKMLDIYILDYLVKKNFHETAEIFSRDANVRINPVAINEPYGFLTEWWTMFWDIYSSGELAHPQALEDFNVKPTQMMEDKQQNTNRTVPNLNLNQQRAMQFPLNMNFDKMMGQPESTFVASSLPFRGFNPNLQHCNANILNPSKPSSSDASQFQLEIPHNAEQQTARDKSSSVNRGRTKRTKTTFNGIPKPMVTRAGLQDAGLEKGANQMLLKGRPLTGLDQVPHSMSFPPLNSLLPVPNQQLEFQTSIDCHQQNLMSYEMAKARGMQTSPLRGSPNNSGNRPCTNNISGTDYQPFTDSLLQMRNGLHMTQAAEQPMLVPMEQTAEQNTGVPMGQIVEQQKDQLMLQQLPENGRKRKNLSDSWAEENALDEKDAVVEKPSNTDIDIHPLLSCDGDSPGNTSTSFSEFQQSSTSCSIKHQNGFSFKEVGSVNSSKRKILCCHFSTDGEFVASAGYDRKVLLWRTSTYDFVDTVEGHSHHITDVRFKPNSSILATSSFDKTVQIWDANQPSHSMFKLFGHTEQVTSLDFHPSKVDILCSCDSSDEIRLWSVSQCACMGIFKGATRQVRFQPPEGNLLAAASGNRIALFDVETNSLQCYLEGHVKEVRSICWDPSGKYIASVSEDSARVWAVVSGNSIYELHSNQNKFESCTFHPTKGLVVIIGSYKSINLWNPIHRSGKPMAIIPAHDGIISALADCPQTGMIASVSHDRCIKLWR